MVPNPLKMLEACEHIGPETPLPAYAEFCVGLDIRVPGFKFPYWKLNSGMRCLLVARNRAAYAELCAGVNAHVPEFNFPVLN